MGFPPVTCYDPYTHLSFRPDDDNDDDKLSQEAKKQYFLMPVWKTFYIFIVLFFMSFNRTTLHNNLILMYVTIKSGIL
jgi:hypothetical protein